MKENFTEFIQSGEKIEVAGIFTVNNKEIIGPRGRIGNSAFISKINQSVETMKQSYELTFLFENKFHTIPISTDEITPSRINQLSQYGVAFDLAYSKDFSRYLNFQRQLIKTTKIIEKAGWVETKDELKFVISDDSSLTYGGDLAITTKGNFDDWIEGVREHVLGYVELELVLSIALSSVLIGYDSVVLGKDIGSGIINLFGDSSSIFALSCYGEPISQQSGALMRSFSSTKNSMVKSLAGLNGIMLCFDDLSAASTTDVSDLIYNIGNGKEKDRLNESSRMQEGASFVTQVLVTGEESLEQYTKKNGGISVRYIEFDGLQYTQSSDHSEQIKKTFRNHYGFAAPKFAEYLLSVEEEEIATAFDEIVNSFKSLFPNSNGKIQRFIKRISAIFLTSQLIENCFEWTLSSESIYNLLVQNIKKQALLLDYSATTLDLVLSWVHQKQNQFSINQEVPKNNGDIFGEIDTNSGFIKVSKEVFESIVEELGLPSANSILKEWKKIGVTKTEGDRLYWRNSSKRQFVWLNQTIEILEAEDLVHNDSF